MLFVQSGLRIDGDAILDVVIGGGVAVPEPILRGNLELGAGGLTVPLPPGDEPVHVEGFLFVQAAQVQDLQALSRIETVGAWCVIASVGWSANIPEAFWEIVAIRSR